MLRLVQLASSRKCSSPVPSGRSPALSHGDGRLQDLGDQRLDEGLLRGEPSIERAHPDARDPGHVGHAGLEPLLLEDLAGRGQQALRFFWASRRIGRFRVPAGGPLRCSAAAPYPENSLRLP